MSAFMRLLLCHGQHRRSSLVCGACAQDACVTTLFKSPWRIKPSILLVSLLHGGRSSREIRFSSSSVRRGSSLVESGKAETIEQVWKEYFADPLQWWDNRVDKRNAKSPDFKHKVTRKALWVDGWSTPPWVKAMLKLETPGKLESHVGYHIGDSQEIAHPIRSLKGSIGRRNALPISTRGLRQTEEGGNVKMHIQSAKTMGEVIVILKKGLQQGIIIDSHTYVEVLKRCLKQKDLVAGKQVHNCIIKSGMKHNIFVANNVLSFYIKCGRLQDAWGVFGELVKKDIITWNIMIGGYAGLNCAEDAISVFKQMCQEGVQPDRITYLSILKACASPSALKWGKEVHAYIRHGGFESDVRVGTALLKMYAKCGSINDVRLVFDNMAERDVITWTVMIGALAESGCGVEAYHVFLQMIQEGFKPNSITYLSILNPCASAGALGWMKEVHRHACEAGLEADVRVGGALVQMYAKSGSMDDAQLVFGRMDERDLITWTVMIGAVAESGRGAEAYQLFLQMIQEGLKPDPITYLSLLNPCASAGALVWVKKVHSHALKAGLVSDVSVGNALVHMYAKCGSINDVRLVFDRMHDRDVITWNVVIGAYAESGSGVEAYQLFLQMIREGFSPDSITYLSILNPCARAGALVWVKEVHRHACGAGLDSDVRVATALVHMYAKCGNIGDAQLVFDAMAERDVVTWNVMIGALAEIGCGVEAYQLFLQMIHEGLKPDPVTYLSLLNPCASAGALAWVKEVHRHACEAGLDSNVSVGNVLVHMYAKCGNISEARQVFDNMAERNVVTCNVMIGGLAQHGCGHEALEVFRKMVADGVKPDGTSFVAILSACSHAGLVDDGRQLFLAMSQDYGIKPTVVHCNCMVDLLGRAGNLEEAKIFIDKMPIEPDEGTWGALLGACRSFGNLEFGELAAKERAKLDPLNASTYVLLSNIYADAGMWQEVALVRTMMQEKGVRKEPGCSWIEVDNKIHEFVVGDTSHPETEEIYAELRRLTKKIKDLGYLPDTGLVLHNIDEKDKEFALCTHSEKLAIAYGLIHTQNDKPLYVYKNLRVCSDCHLATKLISKVTKREIVVRDANRFHHIKDGVCSCKEYW